MLQRASHYNEEYQIHQEDFASIAQKPLSRKKQSAVFPLWLPQKQFAQNKALARCLSNPGYQLKKF